jgi:hypothetical protein
VSFDLAAASFTGWFDSAAARNWGEATEAEWERWARRRGEATKAEWERRTCGGGSGGDWELGFGRSSAQYICYWWAWAEIILWASFDLFLLYIHTTALSLGSRQGTGTGIQRTLCSLLPPTGMKIDPLRSPQGLKVPHLHPLMEEIPMWDRGPIAIPSNEMH